MHTRTLLLLSPNVTEVELETQRILEPFRISDEEVAPHQWCPVHPFAAKRILARYSYSTFSELVAARPEEFKVAGNNQLMKTAFLGGKQSLCTFNHNLNGRWDYWTLSGEELFLPDFVNGFGQRFPGDFARNMRFVKDLPPEYKCGAILTPDGKWREMEEFGWAMLHSDEENHIPEQQWNGLCVELLVTHLEYLALELDVHS